MPRKGYRSPSPLLQSFRRVAMGLKPKEGKTPWPIEAILAQIMQKDGLRFVEIWKEAESMHAGKKVVQVKEERLRAVPADDGRAEMIDAILSRQ